MKDKEIKDKFITSFFTIGIGTLANILIGFLTTPIITRMVEPMEYGQWSIFRMYSSIALMILCLGLDQSLVRYYYYHENINYKKKLVKFCMGISMTITLIFLTILLGLIYFNIIYFEFSFFVALLLCINIILSVFNRFILVLLRLSGQNLKFSVCSILTKLSFAFVAIVLILKIEKNYFILLCVATTISMFVANIYAFIFTKNIWTKYSDWEIVNKKEILRYGLPFIISMGITALFDGVDRISLNYYCEYNEVGIYSSALQVVNIFAIVQTSFNVIWTPIQAKKIVDKTDNSQFFSKMNSYITIVMFGFGATFVLFKDFIVMLLGTSYRDASSLLPFLIFHPIMYTISETTNTGIELSKKSYLYIIVGGISCISNFIGNMILIPVIGVKGAAISTGVSYVIFWGLRTYFSYINYRVNYKICSFLTITFSMMIYCFFNSVSNSILWNLVGYSIIIILIIYFYKNEIFELFNIAIQYILKKINRNRIKD